MDCTVGVLLPDEQDKHMEKESGYGLSGGGATCDNKGGTQMGGIVMRCVQGKRKRKDSMYIQLWRISWMRNR